MDIEEYIRTHNPYDDALEHWTEISKTVIFENHPDLGSGVLYYWTKEECPFIGGEFIDNNGKLWQVQETCEENGEEGFLKNDHSKYTLVFREYEGKKYMYVLSVNNIYAPHYVNSGLDQ